MWNIGWTRLATLGLACLATGQLYAAPATQPARTESAETNRTLHFTLAASAYPAGIVNEEQYQQYLANELREANKRIESSRGHDASRAEQLLRIADFALTQASEPDLTRAWLWRQPQAEPELGLRALRVAHSVLEAAGGMVEHSGQAAVAPMHANRIQMLSALLAMEEILLARPDKVAALRAADLADAAVETVPVGAQATWELLIAGCLEKAGQREDAQLRLQRLLRRHKGSVQAAAALMFQARMLAETGNDAAAVGLLSEYLQALPAMATQPADAPSTQSSDEAPGAGVMQTSLSLVRARLLADWAKKIEESKNDLDRQSAVALTKQASKWQEKAEAHGPYLIRLRPMLEELEQPPEVMRKTAGSASLPTP